ncbi:cysteine and histidine-rich domain-containing protein [Agrilus planipennis]|uniref:Cysteine and histidine-rich domain-containing protein n=1 Tax=Agrilus planipennis TaxID=224129 RepID=A0A1W4XML5_AGRPL|nr:cysteine and histidine-rich domain-containing protein [Agrilus planipennis]
MEIKDEKQLLQCYNRGCGQQYDPLNNKEDSCRHHPGSPFFHDAYKGWSCCSKKCTDFTEFLNIKGCTLSRHSNIKPPEPEKPVKNNVNSNEVIEVKPVVTPKLQRPPFESHLSIVVPEISPSFKQQLKINKGKSTVVTETEKFEGILVGTNCKNGGCSATYEGPSTDETVCIFHSGVPIFHEGMKYWSCCQRKTSDFTAFLSQEGCERGNHKWIKESDKDPKCVNCRWDWHQTGSHVIVTIYAKDYCPDESFVKLNPIRLQASLVFPSQNSASFNIDLELRGVIKVDESTVSMYGTKVEIKLKKAEPGLWSKLDFAKKELPESVDEKDDKKNEDKIVSQIDAVNLEDI